MGRKARSCIARDDDRSTSARAVCCASLTRTSDARSSCASRVSRRRVGFNRFSGAFGLRSVRPCVVEESCQWSRTPFSSRGSLVSLRAATPPAVVALAGSPRQSTPGSRHQDGWRPLGIHCPSVRERLTETPRRCSASFDTLLVLTDAIDLGYPQTMQARTSSGSSPGYCSRICSIVMPSARKSTMSDTQIRWPRMHGWPWQTAGSVTMRWRSCSCVMRHVPTCEVADATIVPCGGGVSHHRSLLILRRVASVGQTSPRDRPQKRPHQIFETANCSGISTSWPLPSMPWAQGVAGSNPVAPTTSFTNPHKSFVGRDFSPADRIRSFRQESPAVAAFDHRVGPKVGPPKSQLSLDAHFLCVLLFASTSVDRQRSPFKIRMSASAFPSASWTGWWLSFVRRRRFHF